MLNSLCYSLNSSHCRMWQRTNSCHCNTFEAQHPIHPAALTIEVPPGRLRLFLLTDSHSFWFLVISKTSSQNLHSVNRPNRYAP